MYFEQTNKQKKTLFSPFIAGENHCVLEANLTLNPLFLRNLLCKAFSFSAWERSVKLQTPFIWCSNGNDIPQKYMSLRQMAWWILRGICDRLCDAANTDEFQFCQDQGVWISPCLAMLIGPNPFDSRHQWHCTPRWLNFYQPSVSSVNNGV